MSKQKKKTRRIGILRGMETSFPEALIEYINDTYGDKKIECSFVEIDAVSMDDDNVYDVILDRISHEVPFYRSYLKWCSLKGTYIVNNPFWWSADDKFIDNIIAAEVDVAVPRTVILPHKQHPPNTKDNSFRNLKYPVDWDRVFEYIGFPAFLKPFDGGGWRGVSRVTNADEFYAAYDESGTDCMMLQEGIEFESYFRCYGVGQTKVHIMPYNPAAEPHLRYKDIPEGSSSTELLERIEKDVVSICKALGYDLNTVEFAVRDGIPYAIDFMNPAPDADYHSVGYDNFAWIVNAVAEMLVAKAEKPDSKKKFSVNNALAR
ncbi:MAG: hypothetical protein HKN43_06865 [Rhodothermales bacterium]|nr:hypothetical protein [Rhodothermales bacterium]